MPVDAAWPSTSDESHTMTTTPQTLSSGAETGAHLSSALQEAMRENTHDQQAVTERLTHTLSDLTHKGKEAASDVQHRLEKEVRKVSTAAEHYIQEAPFKSVLIAAGTGAAAATLLSWWMSSRSR